LFLQRTRALSTCSVPFLCWNFSQLDGRKPGRDSEAIHTACKLCSKMLGVQDFVWVSGAQLPRCILDALHGNRSMPRIHLYTFKFGVPPNKHSDRGHRLVEVDDDYFALATSPNLYSLNLISILTGLRRLAKYSGDIFLTVHNILPEAGSAREPMRTEIVKTCGSSPIGLRRSRKGNHYATFGTPLIVFRDQISDRRIITILAPPVGLHE
jgi:hypothetical protein